MCVHFPGSVPLVCLVPASALHDQALRGCEGLCVRAGWALTEEMAQWQSARHIPGITGIPPDS